MEKVAKMRRYRTADVKGSQFFSGSTKNEDFAKRDLELSGLDLDDIEGYAPVALNLIEGAVAGYQIPYYDLQGRPLVTSEGFLSYYRVKLDYPKGVKGQKYTAPSNEAAAKHGVPGSPPYIPPIIHSMPSEELICAEGEKKCASVIKHMSLPSFGIGGCQNWRDPDGNGRPHPWILELIRMRGVTHLKIIPDSDILSNFLVKQAYGTFASAIARCTDGKVQVTILNPPGKIDDLLVEWGEERVKHWNDMSTLDPGDLVESIKSLIPQYGLMFKPDAKGNPIVDQNSSNVMRLMRDHPAIPPIWLNEDNNHIMISDDKSVPNFTDMSLANFFQHNLGFNKVTDNFIHNCIITIAQENRKSPFLNKIREQDWDGVERLDGWLSSYWGVEDSAYTREVAAKWLISACARLDKPGTKIDWMMIAIGAQSTGKTTMPSILFPDNSLTLYGEHNDKDFHMLLHSKLVVGFDELDSFGRKEASNLKAMITRNEDAFRPPYGTTTQSFPRRFTLYGCGNKYEFIQQDDSGYRRYAVIEVTQLLDFARLIADRWQIWAEAWQRYQTGEVEFWKVDGASEEALKYVAPNMFEEKIQAWIETHRRPSFNKSSINFKDGYLWFTVAELLHDLQEDDKRQREAAGILRHIEDVVVSKYPISGPAGGPVKKRYYRIPQV